VRNFILGILNLNYNLRREGLPPVCLLSVPCLFREKSNMRIILTYNISQVDEAEEICNGDDEHLVSIMGEAENSRIHQLIKDNNVSLQFQSVN